MQNWTLENMGLCRGYGFTHTIVLRNDERKIFLFISIAINESLLSGPVDKVKQFTAHLGKRFMAEKIVIELPFQVDVCGVEQDKIGHIRLPMRLYLGRKRGIARSKNGQEVNGEAQNEVKNRRIS